MSNATNRNFGILARERDRRLTSQLEGSAPMGMMAVTGDPAWDTLFGSLHEQQDAANAAGLGFRADLASIGREPGPLGFSGRVNPLEADSLKRQAINRAAHEDSLIRQEQNAAQKAYLDQQDAQRQGNLNQSYDQFVMNQAFSPPVEPTTVTQDGNRYTMRPDTSAAPTDPRATLRTQLDRLPPNHPARMQVEQQIAALDAKNAQTALDTAKAAEATKKAQPEPTFAVPTAPDGTPLSGEAVMRTLPTPVQGQVKAVLEGRQQLPSGTALKDPYWKRIIEAAHAVDPSFDAVNYNARANTRKDFTSGAASKQINGINTVVGHLHDLAKVGSELGNTGLDWVNKVYNALTPGGTERGVKLNNFQTLKEGVGTELMRVWRQVGAGSEKEIEDWKKTIDAANSPQELQGAFSTIGGMLESKLDSLDNQYKQGMGTDAVSAISPESRARLDAIKGGRSAPSATPSAPKGGADPLGIR